jgi:hypothetical protein
VRLMWLEDFFVGFCNQITPCHDGRSCD